MAPTDDADPKQPHRRREDEDELEPIELEPPDEKPPSEPGSDSTPKKPTPEPPAERDAGAGTDDGTYELATDSHEPEAPAEREPAAAAPRVPYYRELQDQDQDEDLDPRYCLACGQSLSGVDADACPKCSHPFDPLDPSTYRKRPPIDAGPDPAETTRLRILLGALLGALLLGRLIVVLLADAQTGRIAVTVTHPFWIAAVIWIVFSLVRNERITGLMFWMTTGAAVGMFIGAFEGMWTLGSGLIVGLLAGFLREFVDITGGG
ncbi:MAG: hypothetical protein ACODAQ_07255 [Phycisphaeraceae bacterium]